MIPARKFLSNIMNGVIITVVNTMIPAAKIILGLAHQSKGIWLSLIAYKIPSITPIIPHNGNEIKVTSIIILEGLNLVGDVDEENLVSFRDLNIVIETVQMNNDDIKNPDAIPAIT